MRWFRELQLEMDRDTLPWLTDEQVENARQRLPLIFEFEIGDRFDVHPENGRGF